MEPYCNYASSAEKSGVQSLKERINDSLESEAASSWLSDITLLRYLRARGGDVERAEQMLRKTFAWRSTTRPEQIRWEDVEQESRTGKLFILKHPDKSGRPVLVMRPRNENSSNHDSQIRNLIFMMETVSFLADESGSVQITLLLDFEGYSLSNAPALKTSRETLSILQNHYPERMSKALLFRAPGIFNLFWKAISPFIDPVTYKKIHFVDKKPAKEQEIMASHFHLDLLEPALGGSGEPAFDLDELGAACGTVTLADAGSDPP
eukprot:CAMPEP_0177619882 /NCGR_PEP_ID=MMETSP0419_2-20121207/26545_1 /TAXON_ID=582737 /ORGANISM="Tetraselmis sp., Strain GSL018" /LENGTH=263 /DNA_ID=CAMNT_0019119275 /DNA_START=224 /DNA_END=1012 /DNA_ORIENTATION=+